MIYLNQIFIMVTRLVMFSLVLSLMSCKSTLEVEGNFPTPVINIIPLNVGIIYEKQFQSYRTRSLALAVCGSSLLGTGLCGKSEISPNLDQSA